MKRINSILSLIFVDRVAAFAGGEFSLDERRPRLPRLSTGLPRQLGVAARAVISDPWTLAALERRRFTGGAAR